MRVRLGGGGAERAGLAIEARAPAYGRSARAAALLNEARAAGHPRRPRRDDLRGDGSAARARRARAHPGRDDAARHRRPAGVASAQPRHDGHARRGLGQHRDPGGGPPDRLRHALRRSRHRQPAAPTRRTRSKIHIEIDPSEINKNVPVDVALVGDLRDVLDAARCRRSRRATASPWLAEIDSVKRRLRRPRHPVAARRRASVCRARHQRSLAGDARRATRSSSPTSASTRCGRRSTTITRRRARSSPRAASAPWASPCRPRSAPSARGPKRTSGRSSATAGSR